MSYLILPKRRILSPPSNLLVDWDSPQAQGLVGFWPLNDSGIAKDYSVFVNNGALFNNPPLVLRELGPAYSFNGSNQYVLTGTSDSLTMTGPFSLVAFINVTDYTGDYRVIFYRKGGAGDARNYWIDVEKTTGKIRFGFTQGGAGIYKFVTSNTSLTLNKLTHVIGVFDGAFLRIYINGIQDNSLAQTGVPDSLSGTNTYIGAFNGVNYFSGSLNGNRIYNRALSASEAYNQYNNPFDIWWQSRKKLIFTPSLKKNYKFFNMF